MKRSSKLNSNLKHFSKSDERSFLKTFKKSLLIVLICSTSVQIGLFFTPENIFCSAIALFAWLLTDYFILQPGILKSYALSTTVILGFSLTQFCLPSIFTLIEAKPLIYNLDNPYEVFAHSIIAMLVLIISHGFYRYLDENHQTVRHSSQRFFAKLDFYTSPPELQVWIMGFFGISSMAIIYFTTNTYAESIGEQNGGSKILNGLFPFAYSPLFLLLRSLYSTSQARSRYLISKIVTYAILIIIIGIAANTRGLIMNAIASLGISYFLALMLGKLDFSKLWGTRLVVFLALFWMLTGPLADLGTAMLAVRGDRSQIAGVDLIKKTLDAYSNKDLLAFYKKTAGKSSDWNEHYFDNIFLARFCNIKFNDEGLNQYKKIGKVDSKFQEYSIDKIWTSFPQPVLNLLDVNVNKTEIISSSFGDRLFARAGGSNALGGFRSGQFASTGMAAFGWWYLAVLSFGILPVFFLLDLFVLQIKNIKTGITTTRISLAGLIPITSFFMFLSLASTAESVINVVAYILRGWPQLVLLYWTVFHLSRVITNIIQASISRLSK